MTHDRHYVRYFSPGSFVSEQTETLISEWDAGAAAAMAAEIVERYGAKPYGFEFLTKVEADPVPDGRGGTLAVESRVVNRSGMHFISGRVLRYDDVPESSAILRSNMRCNGWPLVCETSNSWKHVAPFEVGDVVVDACGRIFRSGADLDLWEYRAHKLAEWKSLKAED